MISCEPAAPAGQPTANMSKYLNSQTAHTPCAHYSTIPNCRDIVCFSLSCTFHPNGSLDQMSSTRVTCDTVRVATVHQDTMTPRLGMVPS